MADFDTDKTDMLREAILTFLRIQAGKRLISLGGTVPQMQDIERRREQSPAQ